MADGLCLDGTVSKLIDDSQVKNCVKCVSDTESISLNSKECASVDKRRSETQKNVLNFNENVSNNKIVQQTTTALNKMVVVSGTDTNNVTTTTISATPISHSGSATANNKNNNNNNVGLQILDTITMKTTIAKAGTQQQQQHQHQQQQQQQGQQKQQPLQEQQQSANNLDISQETEDCRKKRCADRYDSSESSDSGVAALSCTDSSTTSSDTSDPGSPYSSSSLEELQSSSSNMPPQMQTSITKQNLQISPHQWPWNKVNAVSTTPISTATGTSEINPAVVKSAVTNNNNNSNHNNNNNNNTTTTNNNNNNNNNNNSSLKRSDPNGNVTNNSKRIRVLADKASAVGNTTKKTPSTSAAALIKQKAAVEEQVTPPQTKITGYFKSQMKQQLTSYKKDLTNLVIRSKEFPKTNLEKYCNLVSKCKASNQQTGKTNQLKGSSEVDVGKLTAAMPSLKKIERKTAKAVIPIVSLSKKTISQKTQIFASGSKRPVTIAPRAPDNKKPTLQPNNKMLTPDQMKQQPTVLLTAIRIPQAQSENQPQQQHLVSHHQMHPEQMSTAVVQGKASPKIGPMFQFHTTPVMSNFMQIPNILAKGTNLVMNNGQLARLNGGAQYFLNGALLKLTTNNGVNSIGTQQLPSTTTSTMPMDVDNSSMLAKPPTISTAAVPFATSKSLPQSISSQSNQPLQQQQQQFSTTNFTQSVFMTTPQGIIVNAAIPTMITSQLSGLNALTSSAAMPLHHLQSSTTNLLPSISTILQAHHPPPPPLSQSSSAFVTTENSVASYQFPQPSILSNIPSPIISNLASKIAQPSFPSSLVTSNSASASLSCSSSILHQQQINQHYYQQSQQQNHHQNGFTTTAIISPVTSTVATTNAIISSSATIVTEKMSKSLSELPKLVPVNLNVNTALPAPIVPIMPTSLNGNDKINTPSSGKNLCSPTIPSHSPKEPLQPLCLLSPKSLVLERIQLKSSVELNVEISETTTVLYPIRAPPNEKLKSPRIETELHSATMPECAKSPILSQPKTIRFPPMCGGAIRIGPKGIRKSDGRVIGVCYWDQCMEKYDTSSKLLDHLQTQHVNSQTGPFSCLWSGCKVHSRESCSRQWLERHVLSHGGTKTFKCIIDGCGQRFGSQLALQKHVNLHLNTTESSSSSTTRRSSDPQASKLIRRNGKKLRYRRQPWSARMFDYFDSGIMEGLQHRLLISGSLANGPDGSITFNGHRMARRISSNGIEEVFIKWMPANIISDEWIQEVKTKLSYTKNVTIQSMTITERISLQNHLRTSYKTGVDGNQGSKRFNGIWNNIPPLTTVNTTNNTTTSTKRHRKPPKKMPS